MKEEELVFSEYLYSEELVQELELFNRIVV